MNKWRPVSGLKAVSRTKFTHSLEKCEPIKIKHSKHGLCYLSRLVAQQIWMHLELLVLSPTQRDKNCLANRRTSGSWARTIQRSTRYGFLMNWMYHSPGLALESRACSLKCPTSKRRYVETAGSEQTSSVIMLWAKTRVYVCSGRAGGNERHLLFFVRYVETCPQPHPHPTC